MCVLFSIKEVLLNSKSLHPADTKTLRHSQPLHVYNQDTHSSQHKTLANVQVYLKPRPKHSPGHFGYAYRVPMNAISPRSIKVAMRLDALPHDAIALES